jgi:hypothetical protein
MAALVFAGYFSWSCAQGDPIVEKGPSELGSHELFSRPFTVFDQLLYALAKHADESVEHLKPHDNEFRFLERVPGYQARPSARVESIPDLHRVAVGVSLEVSGMNDPWREVCERHVKDFASLLRIDVPPRRSGASVKYFFGKLLGPTANQMSPTQLAVFLDALVVVATFNVASNSRAKPLSYTRQCFLDGKSGKVTFREHKY